jgi:ankyrin repeat protein
MQEKPLLKNLPAKRPVRHKADIMPSEKPASSNDQKWLNDELRVAAVENRSENILQLISQGADAAAKSSEGYTALFLAVANGNADICALMLQKCAKGGSHMKELLAETNAAEGWAMLHCAACFGHTEICALLIREYANAGGNTSELILAKDDDGKTALHYAKANKHAQTARLLAKVLAARLSERNPESCSSHCSTNASQPDF